MTHTDDPVMIDGAKLDCATLTAVARGRTRVAVTPEGLARAAAAHQAALAAMGREAFYLPGDDEDHPLEADIAAAERVIAAWT